jgi:hypothetical protein
MKEINEKIWKIDGLSNFEDFFYSMEKDIYRLSSDNIKFIVVENVDFFNFECHFKNLGNVKNQLSYYKRIIEIIKRDYLFYNDYEKIINKFREKEEKLFFENNIIRKLY